MDEFGNPLYGEVMGYGETPEQQRLAAMEEPVQRQLFGELESESEEEEDDDDEEVMERLRAARRRLDDLEMSDRHGTGSRSPELSPPDLRASSWGMYEHGTKPRSSSSVESSGRSEAAAHASGIGRQTPR